MSLPIYAKFDGIEGSSQVKGVEKFVEIHAMEHNITIPVSDTTSVITSARQHGPIVLTAEIDKAYVGLMKACCTGTPVKKVEIDFFEISPKDAKNTKYLTIKLEEARVTGVRTWFDRYTETDQAHKQMADYSLRYGKITWTYQDGNIEYSDEWNKPNN